MAKNKTTETEASVAAFINAIADEKRRQDFSALVDLFEKETKLPPKMWGPAIVGFGSYHYKYASGREGDAPIVGLASRVNAITLYVGCGDETGQVLLNQLGKYKISKACIYIKKYDDINPDVLAKMIKNSVENTTGCC